MRSSAAQIDPRRLWRDNGSHVYINAHTGESPMAKMKIEGSFVAMITPFNAVSYTHLTLPTIYSV